jgi:hypothetical protein
MKLTRVNRDPVIAMIVEGITIVHTHWRGTGVATLKGWARPSVDVRMQP